MSTHPQSLDRRVFEDLRQRLVDRTRRNRLLHFKHSARAAIVRVVDELLDQVIGHLQGEGRFRFRPLPDPEEEAADERTEMFRAALTKARITDEVYRAALAGLDSDDPSASAKEARIERDLRDRVRARLGLPPRPQRKGIDLIAYARGLGVDASLEMPPSGRPPQPKHTDNWLQTLLFPDQLRTRLSSVFKKAKEIEQETGVSTLHLAFGFLEWFESDTSDEAFCSPLLLLPVGLERQRMRGGMEEFQLAAMDSTPVTNLSLELRLRRRPTIPESGEA